MKEFKVFITIVLLSLASYNVEAQSSGIDSLYIVPGQPTTNDEIELVIKAVHIETPCYLDTAHVEIIQSEIHIETDYFTGWGSAFCVTIDTVVLGMFNEGHYDLWTYFDHNNIQDSDSLSFFVGPPTNIAVNVMSEMKLNLFPNPNNGEQLVLEFHPEALFKNAEVSMYDNTGRMVLESQLTDQGRHVISLPSLSQGLYFIKINHEGQMLSKKFLVY